MWHWQSCMKIMEKLWGSSFQSNQPTSPVGEKQHFTEKRDNTLFLLVTESTKTCYHRDFLIIWQVLQTLATYPSQSLVSILSSTSARARLTTLRNTRKQQVRQHVSAGNRCCFFSWKWIASDDQTVSAIISFQVTWFVCLVFIYSMLYIPLLLFFFLCQELKRPSCSPWGQPKPWRWQLWM